ncbi:MAG: DEAD/DEAH box helicase, partial [Methylomonas sp.]
QQAKGKWTKGRLVALKRLHSERDQFDYLSEYDHKLCDEIKEFRDHSWYGSGTTFEFSVGMPLALVGHPLLFWADTPEARVEVVQGQPELLVKKLANSDKIKISMEPMPSFEQKMYVYKETPTRLKVVEFTPEHHKICSVVTAKGLEVPLSAQERVLQTLTSISGLLTVHSDIGGSSSTAEQVSADATPRIHLLPMGEGLRVALLIRPLATAGAYYQPGRGGESVLAEVDGKPVQAKRDLALEKQRAEQLLATCTELQQAQRDSSGEWLLEAPEQCLELLLQIQSLPEGAAILEWPEGVKFKLLGQTAGSGFSMQIKRDNEWFALQGELKVSEDTVIEIQQLLGLLNNQQGRFLQLKDGQFIALTDAFRRRLEDLKAYADISGKKVRLNPLAALMLEDWQDEIGFSADEHWQAHLKRLQDARDYQPIVPSTFQAELRDYQQDGYNWLARLAEWGVGACLADDMGLGKTVQGLALLVQRAPKGPSLIIAPTSVCMNWEKEAQRFAPTLKPQILGSGDRQAVMEKLGSYDLLICSYGLLQQESVAELLASIHFQTVILDEAQWIKNIATRRSQGAMNLQAEFKVIMTGTPLENHLGELWNLFRFINPGLLGSLEQFNQRFAGPIERDRNAQARQQLKKLIQPFILRRTKTQVLQELPPRTEIPVYIELSSEETAFYEALRRESLAVLTSNDAPPGQKQLQILAAITKLRRSCCNTNLVNPDLALPSSKLAAFGDIVDELLANQHKALVFSQFVDHLHLLEQYLQQRGISYQYLDGSTPAKARQTRVDAFQRGEGELFLVSLKAGGVGLNLTAADYVTHMDPWWNPAVEDQASDRAHRMGQQRPVTIYRMIAKNTIEEKIVALHGQKRDLADSLLEGADISGKMSADDLLSLMKG